MINPLKRKTSKWRLTMIRAYADYNASKQWRENRDKCLKSNNYKCRYCKEEAVTAHHLSYDRWALDEEEIKDLVPVCERHHAILQRKTDTPFFARREQVYQYIPHKEMVGFIDKIPVIL